MKDFLHRFARSPVPKYQTAVVRKLTRRFPHVAVEDEWEAFSRGDDWYGPRLDVAVGPFATVGRLIDAYDQMETEHDGFLRCMWGHHVSNLRNAGVPVEALNFEGAFQRNYNARCFLAVEIENRSSRKHLMGGAINAAALGRVAVAVGWTDGMVLAFIRLRGYLKFLAGVNKPTFEIDNLLILSRKQFLDAC
jgi:hypothetical protein